MNSKTTGIWFVITAALLAFIFIFDHYLSPAVAGPAPLLPNLRPAAVTSVQVFPPPGTPEIEVTRTNGGWVLARPVSYPAQTAAIGVLLDALQKLAPVRIGASELRERKDYESEFGLDHPQASLVIIADGQRRQLEVGNRTAPGDQVYLRVVGMDGVAVADAAWLNLIPHAADEWRDTALVNAGQNDIDWIVLTNNARGIAIELRRDPTNHLWRMIRPLPARADTDHIADLLQRLGAASVTRFVTDDPNADLAAFGLQPADLDLWLGRGTNFLSAVHVGKSPTNDASQVYAKREGWNTIVTTTREPLVSWRGTATGFRDTRLFELTAPVAEIEVRGTNHFILRERGSNDWQIVGEKYPADAENVRLFIKALAELRIAEFVNDAVTQPGLTNYDLAAPQREIILRSKADDTNAIIAELDFGAVQTNGIFARRPDENFVYAVKEQDFNQLPDAAWEFRDRRIWNFKMEDVAQITIHQDGKTRQIVHNGPGKWSLAPGSQGFIEDKNIEQTVQMFHQLFALGWVMHNFAGPEIGIYTNHLQITFELKSGEKDAMDFGAEYQQRQTALAAVTLDGERWGFVLPPALYQLTASYLTIPLNVP